MYIKSKVDVEFNTGVNSRETGKLIGKLESSAWMWEQKQAGCNYAYFKEDGTQVSKSGYLINEETIETLWNAVKDSIPSELSHFDQSEMKFYLGFMHEMANIFGIEVSEIELINE